MRIYVYKYILCVCLALTILYLLLFETYSAWRNNANYCLR